MSGGSIAGKVALVTGASRGIGRAVAERLARAGARLALVYRERADLAAEVEASCRAAGAEAVALRADLAAADAASELCRQVVARFGTLHLLVNNAGLAVEDLLVSLADSDLEAMVATNVLGLVRLTRAALRPMIQQREGCIINLSSVLARQPGPGNTVYAGTKGFVEAFTRSLAVEVGRKGIRVCAVAPGVVETGMSRAVRALGGEALRARIPLGRYGTPEEIAALVAFVASDQGAYITGTVLSVDGAFRGP